jgi:hypothetical protein
MSLNVLTSRYLPLSLLALVWFPAAGTVFGQHGNVTSQGVAVATPTTAFTYQARLTDAGLPANGAYDLEFNLYASLEGGAAIETRTRLGVVVTDGVFTVQLDFTPAAFGGQERFLEIAVKITGGPNPFTTLNPRQQITSAPYSIRSQSAATSDSSINSLQLGGVAANQYVLTGDSRLSDDRTPLPGSIDYIQNRTTQQSSTNFNVSGNGILGGTLSAVGAINTDTQYTIGNISVLKIGGPTNIYAGIGIGGFGTNNAFFGMSAGNTNLGSNNTFVGQGAGASNTTGGNNTFIGQNAQGTVGNLSNATAIGAGAQVSASNTMVLGTSSMNVNVPGSLRVGSSGTLIRKVISILVSHDFDLIPGNSSSSLSVVVPGASLTDVVMIGVPPETAASMLIYSGHVESADSVLLRVNNVSSSFINPPSATFRIVVIEF